MVGVATCAARAAAWRFSSHLCALVLDPYILAAPNSYQPFKTAPTRVPEALQEEVVHDGRDARADRVKCLCRGQAGGRAEGRHSCSSLPSRSKSGWLIEAGLAQKKSQPTLRSAACPPWPPCTTLASCVKQGGSVGSLIIKELPKRSVWHPGWQLAAGSPQPSPPPARGALPAHYRQPPATPPTEHIVEHTSW